MDIGFRRLRVLALGHTRDSAVSIFRTDFPALPCPIKRRTQLELNLMHLNKGKFDEKRGDHRFTALFCNELNLIKRPWQQFWEVFR